MPNRIAIMQGRLSPPDPRRLQAFPRDTWELEFDRARSIGLDGIEWLFEADDVDRNPLWHTQGRARIRERIAGTGIAVTSICADYFMVSPLFRGSDTDRANALGVLRRLVTAAAEIGARTILLPVLETSAIANDDEAAALSDAIARCTEADECGVTLGIESELPATEYRALVERCGPRARVYYDTGNNAAQGYDVAAELRALGDMIGGVHLKDRPVGGATVMLGRGAVGFGAAFRALAQAGYDGPVVMQPAFGQNFLDDAAANLRFVREQMAAMEPA